jgi:hypothetical protein
MVFWFFLEGENREFWGKGLVIFELIGLSLMGNLQSFLSCKKLK